SNSDWNRFAGGVKSQGGFYGAFEQPSHNQMHFAYVGGSMADPSEAAMDPIYWSFHCFIDFTWDRWQQMYQKMPTSLDAVLQGFTDSPTPADTVDVKKLGYFYTHPPEAPAPPLPHMGVTHLNPRAVPLPSAIEHAEAFVAAWGGPGPFRFRIPRPDPF